MASFGLGAKRHIPGDLVEIEERQFCPDFMEKVLEIKSDGTVVVEPKVEDEKPAQTVVRKQIGKLPEKR